MASVPFSFPSLLSEYTKGPSFPVKEFGLTNRGEGERAREALKGGRPLRGTKDGGALLQRCAQGALWAVPDLHQGRLELYLDGFQSVCALTERELQIFNISRI